MAKKKKEKGGSKGGLTGLLIIVLLVVMIAGAFFAIIDAIIGFIQEIIGKIVTAILDFFKDPLGTIQKGWANISNFFTSLFDAESFDPAAYENERTDPVVVVPNDKIAELIENLDANINRNTIGLDNVMTKKMMLAYYRGLYFDDTDVFIEITMEDLNMTQEEWNSLFELQKYRPEDGVVTGAVSGGTVGATIGGAIGGPIGAGIGGLLGGLFGGLSTEEKVRYVLTDAGEQLLYANYGTEINPFEIIEGDPEALKGDDGHIYLKSTGMLQAYVDPETCRDKDGNLLCEYCTEDAMCESCPSWSDDDSNTVCYYKIKYYSDTPSEGESDSPLKKLYNHYLENFNRGESRKDYTKAVKDYLATCYTYVEGGIKMYSHRQDIYTEKTWEYENEGNERKLTPTQTFPVTYETVDFQQKVAPYANSVEFMVSLLSTTGSKEFVNAFIEKVGEETYIKMRLYTIQTGELEFEEEEKTRRTNVEGRRKYTAKVTKTKVDGEEWVAVGDDYPVEANITNQITEGKYNLIVWLNESDMEWNKAYYVEVYVNGEKIKSFNFGKFNKSFLWWEWDNVKTSDKINNVLPPTYNFIDISKVKESTQITTTTMQYDVGITEIKTWYVEKKTTNVINTDYIATIQQQNESDLSVYDKEIIINGIQDMNTLEIISAMEEIFLAMQNTVKKPLVWYNWDSDNSPNGILQIKNGYEQTILSGRNWLISEAITFNSETTYSLSDCLNLQYSWVIQKGSEVENKYKGKYRFSGKMSSTDTNIEVKKGKFVAAQRLIEGDLSGLSNDISTYYTFLSLLSNDNEGDLKGKYTLEANYKPVQSGGTLVGYKSVYASSDRVGKLLAESAEEMIETLLRSNNIDGGSNLEILANAFREAMYFYKIGNYNMTNPNDMNYMEENTMTTVNSR